MSHWNHRIVKKVFKDGSEFFGVHEVFYNDAGEIYAYTDNPIDLSGETLEGLKEYINWCLKACDQPVLIDGEVKFARDDISDEDIQEMKSEGLSDDEIDLMR